MDIGVASLIGSGITGAIAAAGFVGGRLDKRRAAKASAAAEANAAPDRELDRVKEQRDDADRRADSYYEQLTKHDQDLANTRTQLFEAYDKIDHLAKDVRDAEQRATAARQEAEEWKLRCQRHD